jgi:hypothetical protein
MYHLTGSTPDVWQRDLDALAAGGFARLVLWDLDNDPRMLRTALDLCAQRSLRGYCLPWNPVLFAQRHDGKNDPSFKYRCVGIDGQPSNYLNPFHAGFRREVLRPYLKQVVGATIDHPALGGYFFDDVLDADMIVSYTPFDREQFRRFVMDKYGHVEMASQAWGVELKRWEDVVPPRIMLRWREGWRRWWDDWCEARQHWWLDWADDALAEMPARPGMERILGDDLYSLRNGRDIVGGFSPEMIAKFDAFSFDYTRGVESLDPAMTNIDRDVAMARDLAGVDKKLTMFLKAASSEAQPFPEMRDVIAQSERCLAAGASGVDYYVYRAWPKNYAFKNCLANQPQAFKELAGFVRGNAAHRSTGESRGK